MTTTITLELPDDVTRELAQLAAQRNETLGEYIARAAAEKAAANLAEAEYFAMRAKRAVNGAALRVFGPDRTGGEPPREGDER